MARYAISAEDIVEKKTQSVAVENLRKAILLRRNRRINFANGHGFLPRLSALVPYIV